MMKQTRTINDVPSGNQTKSSLEIRVESRLQWENHQSKCGVAMFDSPEGMYQK